MAVSTLERVIDAPIPKSIQRQSRDVAGWLFKAGLMVSLLFVLGILAVLLIDVIAGGWDRLTGDIVGFLQGTMRSRSSDEQLGVHQAIYGSLWIAIFVSVIAFPTGVAAALYLEEYAPRNRLTSFVELAIRNLAGVPSVVYGLLGLFLFVERNTLFGFLDLGFLADLTGGRTVAAAGLTMAVLVLPIVIITAQEAIRSVPSSLKEAAYGVGAARSEVMRSHVLPYAAPGILTGTLLAMSRAIGEAAPLILVGAISGGLTSNPSLWDVSQITEKFTALPIVIVGWVGERGRDSGFESAAATAILVLLVFVLLLNMTALILRNRFEKKRG